ncbi:O-antigen polysaccharide polymerase Wzy [Bacillus sp. FSL R7-0642]|uniref:O-antigen polysaccharide polymerase Wzy n=1 Tax=Bacillus sp. FSL R7-0642 TaxID=2921585 RepID=UPI0030F89452
MLVLLNTVSYLRMDSTVQHSFLDGISEFFYAQGGSANLIGYAQTLAIQLPEGKFYTIGRLTDFINNSITQTLFDVPKYTAQSIELALYGHGFVDSVSYILSPTRYITRWGYGFSCIAEMFKEFSYFLVIVGNFIMVMILALIPKLFKKGILGAGMRLSVTRLLLYAPRNTFTSFIVSTFSLINLLTLCIIFLGAMIMSESKSRKSYEEGLLTKSNVKTG